MLGVKIRELVVSLSKKNIHNRKLGLIRSLLATGTLLTLIFNDKYTLFTRGDSIGKDEISDQIFFLQHVNFFSLVPFEYMEWAIFSAIVILVIIIIGWFPRITCFFHLWICLSFTNLTAVVEGGDQITSNLVLLLLPICITDPRRSHWHSDLQGESLRRKLGNLTANLFHTVIKIQVSLIYFQAAIGKLSVEEWSNGTAVYYWFNDPIFGMPRWLEPILDPILSNAWGVVAVTWGVLLLEVLLFMAIIMNEKSKIILLAFGICFHIAIVVIHGLFSFYLAMMGALLLYLWLDNPHALWPIKRIKMLNIYRKVANIF